MKKLSVFLSVLLIGKVSTATGYSGLNNDLIIIYGILIGGCAAVVYIPKGITLLRNRMHKKNGHSDVVH